MSGSKSSGYSSVVSAPYEKNISFPQETQQLLTQTGQTLANTLRSGRDQGGQQYLQDMATGNTSYKQNPYVTQALDALRAQSKDQYARDIANAFSGSQGYGYGVTNRNVSDAYNNYQLQLNQALADTQLGAYDTEMAQRLQAAQTLQQTAADRDMQAAQLAIALGELTGKEYGITPQTIQNSSSKSGVAQMLGI